MSADFASELGTSDDHFKLYGMRAEDFKCLDETCPTVASPLPRYLFVDGSVSSHYQHLSGELSSFY